MDQKDERTWGAMAHVIPLAMSLLTGLGWVASLAMYFMYKERSRFVAFHALQALYFQIAVFAAAVVSAVLTVILIGFLMLAVLWVGSLALGIVAAIKASNGEVWEYPVVGKWARSTVGI